MKSTARSGPARPGIVSAAAPSSPLGIMSQVTPLAVIGVRSSARVT